MSASWSALGRWEGGSVISGNRNSTAMAGVNACGSRSDTVAAPCCDTSDPSLSKRLSAVAPLLLRRSSAILQGARSPGPIPLVFAAAPDLRCPSCCNCCQCRHLHGSNRALSHL